jgi:pantoate--beta-alanine ligase
VIIHRVSTLREPDGLALSSRNLRLDPKQRENATIFYRALITAKSKLKSGQQIETVKKLVREMVESQHEIKLEYFEVVESKNLNAVENVEGPNNLIMCIAGYVGEVRLIDNMFLE